MTAEQSYLSYRRARQVPDDVTGQCPYRYLGCIIIDVLDSYDYNGLG